MLARLGYWWSVAALAALVVAAATSVTVAIISYPRMFDDPNADLWVALLVAVFGLYGAMAAGVVVHRGSPQRAPGFAFGVVAGGLWLGEIWTQAPARLSPGPERVLPPVCVVLAVLTTVAAGVVGGWVTRTRAAALQAGIWAGLVSGAVMTTGMVAIQISYLGLLGARADYQRELAASGMTDMATYMAADAIAASLMHMIINLGLGLLGTAAGWVITMASQQPSPVLGLRDR